MRQENFGIMLFSRKITLLVIFISTLLLFINGCSSVKVNEMSLEEGQTTLNQEEGSLFLLSLQTDNNFKPTWPAEVYAIEIVDQKTNEIISIAVQSMSVGSLLSKGISDVFTYDKGTSSWEGLVNFNLPPGQYRITAIRGGCTRGVGIGAAMATFDFPFDTPLSVNDKEVVYLGRIEMINRERLSEDELPSGDTTITRIPQFNSGFATGTFDVKIFDNLDQDIDRFKGQYPVLGNIKIEKRILPPWKKPMS